MHMFPLADLPQDLCRVVLMELCLVIFPHIQVVLPHAEQYGDIFRLHDVPFAEHRVFHHTGDDLGDIMAEHLPYRVFCANQLHNPSLLANGFLRG